MLIRKTTLEQIKSGKVTVAFRRWKRPTVKTGGTLKTVIGLLNIESVEKISLNKLSLAAAKQAGFESKSELLDQLAGREGDLYRIKLTYAGADPRIELRNKAKLSKSDFTELDIKLERMDARSKSGPWTTKVLKAIKKNPELLASKLAAKLKVEKAWLKPNVRKLKNLGLTISHGIGYSLSPRGVSYLAIKQKQSK